MIHSTRRFVLSLALCYFILGVGGGGGGKGGGWGGAAASDCGTPWTFLLPFF